jgi:hypothetical protein
MEHHCWFAGISQHELISMPFASVACGTRAPAAVSNAIGYAMHHTRSVDAVIRVYDEHRRRQYRPQSDHTAAGSMIETHQHSKHYPDLISDALPRAPSSVMAPYDVMN